ncbi:hypothetical protein TA3x_005752 (plasmid) [Tundrisphaera sp. TA3]|uniref:hypothetical protein n=1 Tax=Tundrisphaera sp. TA3 TaxID=3435775 RepID=UPI003EBA2188
MGTTKCAMARGPAAASIAGGFVRVGVATLLHAWRECQGRAGGAGDFRAWLAAHELRARRGRIAAGTGSGRSPSYRIAELARLSGIGERRAGQAVRRLVRSGLLAWAEDGSTIDFPDPVAGPAGGIGEPIDASLPGRSGTLCIPRRLLRFLADRARPALIATALAALLRCLSRRKAGWGSRGRIKASWVARAFGVDARGVKAARASLAEIGWLAAEGDAKDQWSWNRWGRVYRIDLGWAASDADRHPSGRPPRRESPPLDLDPDPLPEESHPEPGRPGPPGDRLRRGEGDGMPSIREAGPGVPALPRPSLRDIRPEDLRDPARILDLHRRAIAAGWATGSEADRLRYVAAAAHARAVGVANPPGLFRAIVEGRRWGSLTQQDEDRARSQLRALDATRPGPAMPARPAPPPIPGRPIALASLLARLDIAPPGCRADGEATPRGSRPASSSHHRPAADGPPTR